MRPVHIAVTATDNCGLTTAKIISVTSNELITGTGGGPGNKDWELTGQLSLNLRAERSGNATDRIYTIAVECTDVSGNSTTRTIAITVPHSQSLIRGAAK
jgi:hypothetical protein